MERRVARRCGALQLICGIVLGATLTQLHRAHASDPEAALPYDALHVFADALALVQTNYVEPVPTAKLMQGALRGMLSGLEPHSRYLDAEEYRDVAVDAAGKYEGVGLEVTDDTDALEVVAPLAGTPAEAAGIRSGDRIIAIDGVPVADLGYDESLRRVSGAVGTKVRLTVQRVHRKPFDVSLTREPVKLAIVTSRLIQPGIGYLRVASFSADVDQAAREQIVALEKKSPLSGLVLDLRENPGGVVNAAVALADEFLDRGTIVSEKGRSAGTNHQYDAKPGDLLEGKPLVVIVDGGTASAAEIVAGALQDNRRALLIGTRTFGKGLVQTIMPLRTGDAMVLTTARYYTPSGRSIQAQGIAPDVELAALKLTQKVDGVESDYALFEAVNVIRGLIAFHAS